MPFPDVQILKLVRVSYTQIIRTYHVLKSLDHALAVFICKLRVYGLTDLCFRWNILNISSITQSHIHHFIDQCFHWKNVSSILKSHIHDPINQWYCWKSICSIKQSLIGLHRQ